MKFEWQYTESEPLVLRKFLRQHELSRSQLAKLKFAGGQILVNQTVEHTDYLLQPQDVVTIFLAPEIAVEHVVPTVGNLQVAYEDDHFLIVDKPAFVASLPAPQHPDNSMANYVKQHLIDEQAESKVVHVVTRLDRDTSGLMLFTKHGFAHSLMDRQLHTKQLQKTYLALAHGDLTGKLPQHGWIDRPIRRSDDFYMRREVGVGGKRSLTEFWQVAASSRATLLKIHLLTGRTHQIRVHFKSVGHPLVGDNLYGQPDELLTRQALHCYQLQFYHPFLEKMLTVTSPLPTDFSLAVDRFGIDQTALATFEQSKKV